MMPFFLSGKLEVYIMACERGEGRLAQNLDPFLRPLKCFRAQQSSSRLLGGHLFQNFSCSIDACDLESTTVFHRFDTDETGILRMRL